jgi:heme oxygenase
MVLASRSDQGSEFSRRFRLRDATRAEHVRLDALISASRFLASKSRYADYLAATLAARRAIARGLEASGVAAIYPAWPTRELTACLRQDLEDLGAAASLCELDFALSGRAEILGTLYVLEGSSLGARLLQRLAGELSMTPNFGARHMAAQIADGAAWPRFTALLDTAPMDELGEVMCIQAARRTFALFERSYRRSGLMAGS